MSEITSAVNNPRPGWTERIAHLVKGKEILFLFALIPFILGYLTIVQNAYRNNLGFIPPLQTQCVMAGIAPTIVVAFAGLFVVFWMYLENSLVRVLAKYKVRPTVFKIVSTIPIPFLLMVVFRFDDGGKNIFRSFLGFLLAFLILSWMTTWMKLDTIKNEGPSDINSILVDDIEERRANQHKEIDALFAKIYHRFFRYTPLIPLAQFLFITTGFWVNNMYSRLPQEFGGMQPRLAFLAVTRAQLSPEMRQAILPPAAQNLPSDPSKDRLAVAQTRLLDVVYDNNDAMIVRVHADEVTHRTGKISSLPTVYQIKKASIQGVSWCGFDTNIRDYKQQQTEPGKNKVSR